MKPLRFGPGLLLLVVILAAGFTTPAFSQQVTAAVTGTVTDQTGAPIPGASVIATDTERGVTWPTQTNEAGVYTLPRLPIGTYTLRIEAKNFQSAVRPAFQLTLNQIAKIDVQMKVGSVNETVEVTGAAPILQTETTQLSTIIDATTNVSLPLATRNYVQLTLLTPGAVHPNPQSITTANTMTGAGRPYINGNREQANNFMLDGMDNNQVGDNEVGYTPSVDAIQEFNVISQNASAEFGDFQGGIVNTAIKSGTNKLHGSLFEFFRNDKLNANTWANGMTGQTKPTLRWNMFGGTIGGPIIKNKLFFFADYQGQRFHHPGDSAAWYVIPTAQRTGDFSAMCTAGFDGSGYCTNKAQTIYDPTTGLPFVNNTIPAARINSVAKNLFASSFYPTSTDSLSRIFGTTGYQMNNDQGDLKFDYNLSDSDKFFFRWSQMHLRNPSTQSWALASPNPTADEPVQNAVFNWDHTITPNVMNEARFGFNYVKFGQGFSDYGVGNFAEELGIANGNAAGPGLPQINFNGTLNSSIGNPYVLQNFGDSVIQAQDSLIISHGRHTLHTGFSFKRLRVNSAYAGNSGILGIFNFNGQYTATSVASGDGFTTTGGSPVADFLLGMPNQLQRGGAVGWGQRSSVFAGFVQDDWKVTDTLTVNLGLRYENHTPWVEVHDRQVNFGLTSGEIQFAGKNGNSRALYNAYNFGYDFQPRIGVAWAPKAMGGKTVFRGAYSISNYSEGMGSNNRLPQNVPFVPGEFNSTRGCTTDTSGEVPVYTCVGGSTIDQGIPAPAATGDIASVTPASYTGLQIRMWDPNWQPAVTRQYNLSIQQQLSNATTFQVGYVGQRTTNLTNFEWANQKILNPDGTTQDGPYVAGNPALKSVIGAIRGTFSNGEAQYDALQSVLHHRLSKGLDGQVSYTWSKCLTDAPGFYGSSWGASQTAVGMPSAQNIYDLKGDWGNCFFDATHALTGYFTYQLPFGKGKMFGANMNPVLNAIVGNWELGGILTLRSGFHLEVDSWADPTATGGFASRPDLVKPITYPKTKIPNGIQWFDPSSLEMPSGHFGNLGVGAIVGPPLKTFDLSMHKAFPWGDGKRVEFRAEAINLTNTPILLFTSAGTFMGDSTGKITAASGERNIQFAMKFYF